MSKSPMLFGRRGMRRTNQDSLTQDFLKRQQQTQPALFRRPVPKRKP